MIPPHRPTLKYMVLSRTIFRGSMWTETVGFWNWTTYSRRATQLVGGPVRAILDRWKKWKKLFFVLFFKIPVNCNVSWGNLRWISFQSWLFFGFFTCLFGFALLFVPAIVWKFPRFTISALPFVLGGLFFAAFWNFVSVFSFFGLGDAWTYKYKCIIKPDQRLTWAVPSKIY